MHGIDHVGLTVPDLDAAIDFYARALAARQLYRLGHFDSRELSADGVDETAATVAVPDALYRLAMLALPDGTLLELFEYTRPVGRKTPPRNNDLGGHHIGFRVADLAAALARVVDAGGTALAPITVVGGSDETGEWPTLEVNYVLDPWGNQLELVYRG